MDFRSGKTRIELPTLERPGLAEDRVMRKVREAVAADFEVIGEIGRTSVGTIAYLARDKSTRALAALRLVSNLGEEQDYQLKVLDELDASIPLIQGGCPSCSAPFRGEGRFCPVCGEDLSGVTPTAAISAVRLLESVQMVAEERFEIIGNMPEAGGQGVVCFARRRGAVELVAIRLPA